MVNYESLRRLPILTLIAFIGLPLAVLAQLPSRSHLFRQYASSEPLRILDAATDETGMVWLAERTGVFRFDGLRYLRIAGYPFPQASFIATHAGSVWAGAEAGITQLRNGRWDVLSRTPIVSWQRTPRGFWAATKTKLELRDWNGIVLKSLPAPSPQTKLALSRDRLWFLRGPQICSLPADGAGEMACEMNPISGPSTRAFRDGQRTLWAIALDRVTTVGPNHSARSYDFAFGQSNPFLAPSGRVWWVRPLPPPPAVPNWQANPLSDTCELFLDESSRWICADNGLAFSRLDETWEYWTDRSAPGAKSFFFDPLTKQTFIYGRNGIFRLNPSSRQWERLPKLPSVDVRAVLGDGFGGFWIATIERALLRIDAAGKVLDQLHPCQSLDTYRLLRRDRIGRLWVGGKDADCFFELSGRPRAWRVTPQHLPGNNIQAIAMNEDPDRRLWVGYEEGLLWQDEKNQWHPQQTSEPVRLIREFIFESKDIIWVAHRQPGFFTRLQRNGSVWQVTRFRKETHPGDTHFFQRDSRGWLWRGADTAVSVAKPDRTGPDGWLRLDRRSGVVIGEANLNGFGEDAAGYVWLAGTEGILRLKPDSSWFQAPSGAAPVVSRIAIPGQEWLGPVGIPHQFPAGVTEIAIEWSTIAASPFQTVPIKFRWSSDSPWQPAPEARAVLKNPTVGDYTLQAAFTGDGSPVVVPFAFRVGPASETWSSWPILALVPVPVLFFFGWRKREWIRYRLHKLLYLAKLRRQRDWPTEASLTGEVLLSRYRVGPLHAEGGFACVYRAEDLEKPGRPIVIKVLNRDGSPKEELRRRFSQEVAALSGVSHPHIPPLLDSFVTPQGAPVLVLPFYAGLSLRELVRKEAPLAPRRVAQLTEQIGSALLELHRKGLIHRDVKPDNILFADPAHAILIDFGTATARGPLGEVDVTGTITGSMHYMAPERLLCQFSPASDIFSLAIVVLECLTGLRPAQLPLSPQDPDFPQCVAQWMDRATAALLMQALTHQPERRPQDFGDWLNRLVEHLRAANSST